MDFVWMPLSEPCDGWQLKTLGQMDFGTTNTAGGYLVGFNKTILIGIFKKSWTLRFANHMYL